MSIGTELVASAQVLPSSDGADGPDARAVLDAVGVAVVLDPDGVVVDVNEPARLRAVQVGPAEPMPAVGQSYLEGWEQASAGGSAVAGRIADGLREVLGGRRAAFEIEHRGTSAAEERWTELRVSGLAGGGAVATQRDVTDRRCLAQVVASLAGHDPSTGLLDRSVVKRAVAERLGHVRTNGGRVAVTRIALPGLARVAADHGELTAADLAVRVAARMRTVVRSDDILLRTGEADFTLLCTGLGDVGLEALTNRLRELLADGYEVAGRWVETAAVVAQVRGAGTATASGLLEDADAALDEAMALAAAADDTRGAAPAPLVAVADPPPAPLDRGEQRRPADPLALRSEVADLAVYRPIVRAEDGDVVAIEIAPARRTGDGELLVGAEVRSLAAARGLEAELATSTLRCAVAAGIAWQRGVPERRLAVAIELGGADLADRDLAARVAEELDRTGLEPSRLVLGASEKLLMEDPRRAHRQLAQLKMVGVELVVDGFATGKGSIAHLARFPVDHLRVDLGGCGESGDATPVLSAVAGIADALGLRVVADGIDLDGGAPPPGCRFVALPDWSPLEDVPAGLGALGCPIGGRPLPTERLLRRPRAVVAIPPSTGAATGEGPSAAPPAAPAAGEAVERALEDLDLVFRSLVHEVRTPLAVAMGYASLIEGSADGQMAETGRSIRRATERINGLLANLEDVRMIDQDALVLDERELDLRAVVEHQVSELRDVLGLDVRIRADDGAPIPVVADELRIGQVLTNLISNAARYCSRGTAVEVRLWVEGDTAEVAVVDDGPGVPPDRFEVIFEKYGRAETDRSGTGLGLYLASGIARAHGGEISYRRRTLRSGSVFALHLPLAEG